MTLGAIQITGSAKAQGSVVSIKQSDKSQPRAESYRSASYSRSEHFQGHLVYLLLV